MWLVSSRPLMLPVTEIVLVACDGWEDDDDDAVALTSSELELRGSFSSVFSSSSQFTPSSLSPELALLLRESRRRTRASSAGSDKSWFPLGSTMVMLGLGLGLGLSSSSSSTASVSVSSSSPTSSPSPSPSLSSSSSSSSTFFSSFSSSPSTCSSTPSKVMPGVCISPSPVSSIVWVCEWGCVAVWIEVSTCRVGGSTGADGGGGGGSERRTVTMESWATWFDEGGELGRGLAAATGAATAAAAGAAGVSTARSCADSW